jgi:hypothetical protein
VGMIANRVPSLATTVKRQRVVVKFKPSVNLPYSNAAPQALSGHLREGWEALSREYAGVALSPYFLTHDENRLRRMESRKGRLGRHGAVPRFTSYFALDCPPDSDVDAIAREVSRWPGVEIAYAEGGPMPPPVDPSDDPRNVDQGYENAAPTGIDARWAWEEGYDGSSIGFVDVEQGWTLDHEDLKSAKITLISGFNEAYHGHGTAVLGEVVGVDNKTGIVGIAPRTSARVVSQHRPSGFYNTADAILSAASLMSPGDVMLLEAQTKHVNSGDAYVPVEVEEAVFDAISYATGSGIIVVEAGANGSFDLDDFEDTNGKKILNRNSKDFRDSGAIVVGAASPSVPHTRLGFSCFGSRIDCYAWGSGINTTGDGWTGTSTTAYTTIFGGTSGASPIVSGAAILVQCYRALTGQALFDAWSLRELLSTPALNTPSANPASDRIGVMPNLRAIIEQDRKFRQPDLSRWAIVAQVLFGVVQDGGGSVWLPGKGPIPIDPWGPRVAGQKSDLLAALAVTELAKLVDDDRSRVELARAAVGVMQRSVEEIAKEVAVG